MVSATNIRPLTQTDKVHYYDGRPCFDPSGKIVLFERTLGILRRTQLWAVPLNKAGTESEYYSSSKHDCLRAAWSWNPGQTTQQIAFTGPNFPVYTINADQPYNFKEQEFAVRGYGESDLSYPAWYPNSTDLLIANYSELKLIKVSLGGDFLGTLTNAGYFSGMGTVNHSNTDIIAYAGQVIPKNRKYDQGINQIWIQDGGNPPQLFSPMGKGQIGRAPWFTPDGGYLGFENYDENHVMQIWMKPVLEPYEDQPVSQISFGSVVSQHVKFSPDGLTAVWAQGPQIYAADLTYS